MNARSRRFAMCLIALAAVATAAFGQSAHTSDDAVLPKHPIPYKALKALGVKPKAKASTDAAGAKSPASVANPATPSASNKITSKTGVKPAFPKPIVSPAPKPQIAAKTTLPLATPSAPKPMAPKPAVAPFVAATKPPAASPATPVHVPAPPPLVLATLQPSAKLQSNQALPASELGAFIDGQVSRAMVSDHIAGVAVAVVQNGQLVLERGYGQTSSEHAQRIDPRTSIVRLGSASQIFTWIAALKAVEDGKLKLDAPVNGYLPEDLQIPDEGFDRPILFRHLMSHTAGFEDRALGRRYALNADRLLPLDKALEKVRPRRVRAAGLLSISSDYGVALAGGVIARVEGHPFDQLIEDEILKPLALTHTSFREPYPAARNLPDPMGATLSSHIADGFRWTGEEYEPQAFSYGQALAPALSASTTADDMARLMIALLNNGRLGDATLYTPKTAALLRAPLQRPAPNIDGWAHGLAMQRLTSGFETLSESGAAPAFHTNLVLVPSLNLGLFIVANTDTGGELTRALPAAVVQQFYGGQAAVTVMNRQSRGDYAGSYLSAQRAYHGLEAFADRLTKRSTLTSGLEGDLALSQGAQTRTFAPTAIVGQFKDADGADLLIPITKGKPGPYVLASGGGASERVGGLHSLGVLKFWAAVLALTVIASFAGLFIRDRIDPRASQPQIIANITQIVTCVVWCLAFGAFFLFAKNGLSPTGLLFEWPNRWLILASWSALVAGILSLLMVTQIPGAWREERRIHGWSIWRKLRHTTTVGVFLVFTAILAAWGALEPWSS